MRGRKTDLWRTRFVDEIQCSREDDDVDDVVEGAEEEEGEREKAVSG